MEKFKAAVFDLDGTLLYTLEDLADSLNHVLAEEGLPTHKYDDYRFMIGNGMETLIIRALPQGMRIAAHVRPILQKFMERYRDRQCLKTRPYEGAPEMLEALSARGVPLAVFSNKAHPNTLAVIENFFPSIDFKMVLGLREGARPKPDPQGALEIAQAFELPPALCAYLGDSDVDMKTARAAGMYAAGAAWGYRTVEELLANGAQKIIHSPMEFLNIF